MAEFDFDEFSFSVNLCEAEAEMKVPIDGRRINDTKHKHISWCRLASALCQISFHILNIYANGSESIEEAFGDTTAHKHRKNISISDSIICWCHYAIKSIGSVSLPVSFRHIVMLCHCLPIRPFVRPSNMNLARYHISNGDFNAINFSYELHPGIGKVEEERRITQFEWLFRCMARGFGRHKRKTTAKQHSNQFIDENSSYSTDSWPLMIGENGTKS